MIPENRLEFGYADCRLEVLRFSERMEIQLRKNDHKGTWHGCNPEWLLAKLMEEVGELAAAYLGGEFEQIAAEAADVGNLAMMIADVLGLLPE